MAVQPERAGGGSRINAKLFPPGGFIAVAMDLAVMAATKWDCILVTDLAAQRAALSEAEVVRVTGCSAADQAGLLGDIFDMLAVANPARLRQRQNSLVNASRAPPLSEHARTGAIARTGPLRFCWIPGLLGFRRVLDWHFEVRQSGLERQFDLPSIFRSQLVFFGEATARPKRRIVSRRKRGDFGDQTIAQRG